MQNIKPLLFPVLGVQDLCMPGKHSSTNYILNSVFALDFDSGSHHVAQASLEQLTHHIAQVPISVCRISGIRGSTCQNILPVIIHSIFMLVTQTLRYTREHRELCPQHRRLLIFGGGISVPDSYMCVF